MNNNRKKKMVAVGLYVPGTGFTRVLTSLFSRLKDQYEIHWLGVGYKGEVQQKGYTLYPTNLAGGDIYAAYQMADLANEIEADIIFLLNDFWMLKNYQSCIESLTKATVSLAYVPLDGKIDRPEDIQGALYLDHLICYNEFALQEVQNAFAHLQESEQIQAFPQTHVIAHGTDLDEFFPLLPIETKVGNDQRTALKAKIFPQIADPANSFVVLNANRISERKALHLTLQSFARFAKDKTNVYLCLHLPNSPATKMEDLKQLILAQNIQHSIILNPIDDNFINNEQLNELYNACDVGLNTSYGEGWGMIAFEHAATGAVQVVPNHTACGELWKEAGELINIEHWLRLNNNPFLMGEINTDHLVEILNQLYNDPAMKRTKSAACFKFAKSEKFNWSSIAGQWDDLIQQAVKKHPAQLELI